MSQEIEDKNEINELDNTSTSTVDDSATNDSATTDSDNNSGNSGVYEPSVDELEKLSDDEFNQWLNDNNFPEDKKIKDKPQEEKEDNTDTSKEEPVSDNNEDVIDYKAIYEQIFKPFKANGKEIKPKDANDVLSLMQMGANYTKKMQKLAPMRKAAESLARNGISDKDLSFLIDLHKGNKEAIKKLLKDKNFDITDIDIDEENKYQENTNNLATDADLNFQDAIMDSTPENLTKMREILDSWDADSRQKVLGDPQLLRGLDWEISNGRYEQVKNILDSERTFGRYKDYTDLQAYISIAKQLEMQQQQQAMAQSKSNKTNRVAPKAADKSKAAPSKSSKSIPTKSNLTPKQLMEMPEEEFLKLSEKDLL